MKNNCQKHASKSPIAFTSCIQRLQNKVIKSIQFLPFDTNLLSIYQTYIFESIFLVFKMKNSLLRTNFTFPTNFAVTGRNTRSTHHLRLPFFLTSVAQSSIFYKGISLYNSLPIHLKNISRVSTFKIQLKSYVSNTIPVI
jgi:hypothetical protein